MNRINIILTVLVLISCQRRSLDQENVSSIVADSLKNNNGLYYYQNQPYTGSAIKFFLNGQKEFQGEYKEGIEHGRFKKWSEEGILIEEVVVERGEFHGKYKSYYPNGKIRLQGNYINGIPEGTFLEYYESGEKLAETNYKNGEETGNFINWNINGIKVIEGFLLKGKRTGIWNVYDTEGNVKYKQIYENDELIQSEEIKE